MNFTCPDCNEKMFEVYDNGKYVSHGCMHCHVFFELVNVKEFT